MPSSLTVDKAFSGLVPSFLHHPRPLDSLIQYAATYVEYKGGLEHNGQYAILDSAAIQAVSRVLDLHVTKYSLSIHHNHVDVITSRQEKKPGDVSLSAYVRM